MHQFQYILTTYFNLSITSVYWYHRKFFVNKFKWVTYLCTQLYVCISLKLIKCTVDVLQNFIEILQLHVLNGLLSCSLFFKYFAGIYNQKFLFFHFSTLCLIICDSAWEMKVLSLCSMMSSSSFFEELLTKVRWF